MAIAQANAERVNRKKSEILEMINSLRMEFELVNERNSRLPDAMQLNEADFEIDSRITEDIRVEINRQMEADRIEHLVEMNKIRSQWTKIDNVLLNNVECWAISVLGITNNESVETFFIERISDNFQAVQNEFENRTDALKNGSASTQPASSEQYDKKTTFYPILFSKLFCFIRSGNDVVESTCAVAAVAAVHATETSSSLQNFIDFSDKGPLDVQTRRLLKKYKERKQQTIGRQQKVLTVFISGI